MAPSKPQPFHPSNLFLSLRPGAFLCSVISVLVGGALAYSLASSPSAFSWSTFFISFAAAFCAHACGNLSNTLGDFQSGLDQNPHSDDRSLVDGLITIHQIKVMITCFTTLTLVLLFYIASVCVERGELMRFFGLIVVGAFICFAYTLPPFSLKYRALGDVCMIAAFGPVLSSVIFFAQHSTTPPLSTLPLLLLPGLLTSAVLHVNNARDVEGDKKSGASTLAMRLGPHYALLFFIALYSLMYVVMVTAAIRPTLFLEGKAGGWARVGFLLPLLLLPQCAGLVKEFREGRLKDLCPSAFFFAGGFGTLEAIAIALWGYSQHHWR